MASEDHLKKAVAAFNALTPEQQAEMLEEQRQSWVRGNVGLSRDEAAQWHEDEAKRKRSVAVKSKRLAAQIATHEASAAHFRSLNTRPAPAATDTGLETVAHQYRWGGDPKWRYFGPIFADEPRETRALCDRSQAVELLAGRDTVIEMQADSIDKLERKVRHWQDCADKAEELLAAERAEKEELEADNAELVADYDFMRKSRKKWKERAEKAEADNAALTARVKELEADLKTYQDDTTEEVNEKIDLEFKVVDLEAKLAAAEKEAAAWEANYKALDAHYARAVLGGKP